MTLIRTCKPASSCMSDLAGSRPKHDVAVQRLLPPQLTAGKGPSHALIPSLLQHGVDPAVVALHGF